MLADNESGPPHKGTELGVARPQFIIFHFGDCLLLNLVKCVQILIDFSLNPHV